MQEKQKWKFLSGFCVVILWCEYHEAVLEGVSVLELDVELFVIHSHSCYPYCLSFVLCCFNSVKMLRSVVASSDVIPASIRAVMP